MQILHLSRRHHPEPIRDHAHGKQASICSRPKKRRGCIMVHAKARRREGGVVRDVEELASIAIDCGIRLHKELGPGLLESVYEAVMAASLARRGLKVDRQRPIQIEYDGMVIGEGFRADLLVEDRLIIEIKSIERLAPVHGRQLLTYLRLARQPLGLLMNFGGETFREGLKRVVNNHGPFASSRLRVNRNPASGPRAAG
ncbi:MAG TPA: GxxExxY protein [Allosphingosinicella sp.]|nr:GxxExxY protein [Allosphingosinicella sp.]